MPHFYLHIYNAFGNAEDEEGIAVRSLAEARDRAIAGIRSLLCTEVLDGRLNLNGRIEIADTDQNVQLTVPFSEAVTIYGL